MNPRHAAALALIGWYLMVPPHRTCASCSQYFQPVMPKASLDKWKVVHRFDTVTKCKEDLLWFQRKAAKGRLLRRPRIPYVATYGQCVATDDPRLKEK